MQNLPRHRDLQPVGPAVAHGDAGGPGHGLSSHRGHEPRDHDFDRHSASPPLTPDAKTRTRAETVELPEKIQPASSMRLAHDLAKVGMAKVTQQRSIAVKASTAKGDTNCPILADPRNTEAMACAMVLSAMLMPRLLGTHVSSPSIVEEDEKIAPSATHSLLLCSENCFKSLQIQNWILQVGA
eukprot:Skav205028  [mRNA]  locus=scaffold6308:9077:23390:- [translate_table: standard]